MSLPAYFLPRPAPALTPAMTAACDTLFDQAVAQGPHSAIPYTLPIPKWQFLCYLTDTRDVLLHGSGCADIAEFEPRQSHDVNAFGNQRAVYAASDGIWPLFFAVMDREQRVTSLLNACIRIVGADRQPSGPYYFFSINSDALPTQPWRSGTIYILPRASFVPQPHRQYRGLTIDTSQWASLVAVRPLARLTVSPEDFPFLAHIHPHDPQVIRERASLNPGGFPWMDQELAQASVGGESSMRGT